MITDEEAREAAIVLADYCKEHQCENCCFLRGDTCDLDYYAPIDWHTDD